MGVGVGEATIALTAHSFLLTACRRKTVARLRHFQHGGRPRRRPCLYCWWRTAGLAGKAYPNGVEIRWSGRFSVGSWSLPLSACRRAGICVHADGKRIRHNVVGEALMPLSEVVDFMKRTNVHRHLWRSCASPDFSRRSSCVDAGPDGTQIRPRTRRGGPYLAACNRNGSLSSPGWPR